MNTASKTFADFFKDEPLLREKAEMLMNALQEGTICIPLAEEEVQVLSKSNYVFKGDAKQPFVITENHLYLERYYYYETSLLSSIAKSIHYQEKEVELKNLLKNNQAFIIKLFKNEQNGVDWQMVAALNSCLHNFSIITGGPGTGKTTTVAKLLSILLTLYPELKIALAAPTGKAAMRMKESLSNSVQFLPIEKSIKKKFETLTAQTLHRLLGYKRNSPYFTHHLENKLEIDVLIIDESSMIDLPMMAKLLEAIKESTKIVFLGDKNQLASVEAGSVFSDLCTSIAQTNTFEKSKIDFFNLFIPSLFDQLSDKWITNSENATNKLNGLLVELQTSRRFKSDEGIGYFSKLLIEAQPIDLLEWEKLDQKIKKGIRIIADLNEINELVLQYADYIQENDIAKALKLSSKVRVLCATKDGNYGMRNCIIHIERVLHNAKLIEPKFGFYENQLIMITTNNYELGLYNGDIGIVRMNEEKQALCVYFEDAEHENGVKMVLSSYIKNYETAFAMTIHKSQGSEFETAIVIMPEHENRILTRELLYTGVTRAKNEAVILINQEILDYCIATQVQRSSGIIKRLSTWE